MMNTRSIALVIGLLGAGLGLAAAVADSAVLGVGAGAAALCAGVLAVAGPSSDPDAEAQVALLEARVGERDEELARARRSLNDARARLAELENRPVPETGSGSTATTDPPPARRADEPVVISDSSTPTRSTSEEAAAPPDGGTTPTTPSAPTAEEALTDAETQLFSEAYFRVALDARIASARRHLRPVAIALLDVHEGQAAAGAHRCDPRRTAESLRETVRDADTACRLDDGNFAIILEDTPENGAVWTVERVRRNLVSRFGTHTMWAGVACYPAHAFSAAELVEQARVALAAAREWKQDRIEVAIAD